MRCVQETKIPKDIDTYICDYQLICQKTNQKDYKNGFLIHKRLEQHIQKVWKLNDRISILEIQMDHNMYVHKMGKQK